MAVPTITSVTPSRGPSGGQALVEIVGTGFQVQVSGAGTTPTVRVLFGAVEAKRVRVASATRLIVTTPADQNPATVDVVVQNIGSHGEVLGAEHVTATGAYTFARPALDASVAPVVQRVTRQLIQMLKRQVLQEVVLTRNVDWDDDPAETLRKVAIAKMPAVWLVGPTLRENTFFRTSVGARVREGAESRDFLSARCVDLVFRMGCITDSGMQLTALQEALTVFMRQNVYLYLDRDPADATAGRVRWEFGFEPGGDLDADLTPSSSNVVSASGSVSIRGVDIIGWDGFENTGSTDIVPDLNSDPEITAGTT